MTPNELFNKNKALVGYCYKKYIKHSDLQDKEDIIQQGMLALWIVANKYESSKGFSFASYAVPYITGYMKSYIYDNCNTIKIPRNIFYSGNTELIQALSNIESLDAPIRFENDSESFTLLDVIPGMDDEYQGLTKDLVDQFLNTIENVRDREIIKAYYYSILYNDAINKRDLAKSHKISYQSVLNIIYKYNAKFKIFLNACTKQ